MIKKKTVVFLLIAVLVFGATVGGTLAYLIDTTGPIINTFTAGDVDIELEEETGNTYEMVPGHTITKDPKVTVKAVSEKCYVFVKIEKKNNFDTFMKYDMADGWTALDGNAGVFYRVVEDTDADQEFAVLKDNKVTVIDTVTKAQLAALTDATQPQLIVTAYACQYYKNNTEYFSASDAWNHVNEGK